ncbi:MAG: sodium:calcium antiporter [Acidimicrobiales bacterium]
MALSIVMLIGGLALLAYAADQFVLGAARLALLTRVPPLVVGVVVVGFGTSAPEMLVSALAASRGEPEVALGNVIGSDLANLSLLLGVGAIIVPLTVDSRTVRREAVLALMAAVGLAVAVQGGGISTLEGAILMAAMVVALAVVLVFRSEADDLASDVTDLTEPGQHRLGPEAVRTGLGLIGTVAGAQLLLEAALDLAQRFDLEAGLVGATIVALGTSLPELVTVIQSARRRETDLVVGNLLGSNLFNSLAVAGAIGLLGPGTIDAPGLTTNGALAVVAITAGAVLAMRTNYRVTRIEGLGLVAVYLLVAPLLA